MRYITLAFLICLASSLIVVPALSIRKANAEDIEVSISQNGIAKVAGKSYRLSLSISGLTLTNDGLSSVKASGAVKVLENSGKQVAVYTLKGIDVKPSESKLAIFAKIPSKSGELTSSMSIGGSLVHPSFDEAKKGQQMVSLSSQTFMSTLKLKVHEKGKAITYDTIKSSSGRISYSTYVTPKVEKILSNIDQFRVSAIDDKTYQAVIGVLDQDGKLNSISSKVSFSILDSRSKVLFTETKSIAEGDYGRYTQGTDPRPKILYVWSIPIEKVSKGLGQGLAKLTLTTSDGKSFSSTYNNLWIPPFSPAELQQYYEDQYRTSSKEVNLTVTQGEFQVTLIRAGKFTHLKYDTWGDEVSSFRADFAITNVSQKPEYIPTSSVVLDETNNQYDQGYGGSLSYKEVYPSVTVRGYKIYDSLPDTAQLARVILKQFSYPNDMLWTFDVPLK